MVSVAVAGGSVVAVKELVGAVVDDGSDVFVAGVGCTTNLSASTAKALP